MDDGRARQTARRMGLAVKGTLGVLVAAKRASLVPAVAPLLAALEAHGYWLSDALRERVLEAVDELP